MFQPFRQQHMTPPAAAAAADGMMGPHEAHFGLRLRRDGTWQHHPKPAAEVVVVETEEEEEPSTGIRQLAAFALYDAEGRLVPVEILSLVGGGECTAFGTLLPPFSAATGAAAAVGMPPPFPLQEDQLAAMVLLNQPALAQPVPAYDSSLSNDNHPDGDADEEAETERQVRELLEQLPFAPVTANALVDVGIGKRVQRLSTLPQPQHSAVARLALLVKQAWRDVLEQGGAAEPDSVNPGFLASCTAKFDSFLDSLPPAAASPPAAEEVDETSLASAPRSPEPKQQQQPQPSAAASPVNNNGDADAALGAKRQKRTRKVDASELVPEYEWTGVRIEPDGPHADKLVELLTQLRQVGRSEPELMGWRLLVSRKVNFSHGEYDYSIYMSPDGVRYRSRAEAVRAFSAGGSAVSKPPPPAASKNSSSAAPTATATATTATTTTTTATPGTTVSSYHAPFEATFSPPTLLLCANVAHEASMMDVVKDDVDGQQQGQRRIKLRPIGWSLSPTLGVCLYTAKATYQLVGAPAAYYQSFYCNAFLLRQACQLVHSTLVAWPEASFQQIMAHVLMRAEPTPGFSVADATPLLLPESAHAFYYYSSECWLTYDFVVSRAPQVYSLLMPALATTPIAASASRFFSELQQEFLSRWRRSHSFVQLALALGEERRAAAHKRAAQNDARIRERVAVLAKRIEQEADLPDDYLVERLPLQELAKTTSQDPLMHQALERVLAKAAFNGLPVVPRPAGLALSQDPAHFVSMGSNSTAAAATTPMSVLHGEALSRLINVWEAGCLFSRCTPTLQEESLVSFRKQVYGYGGGGGGDGGGAAWELFAAMLRAIARDEFAWLAQPAPQDDVPNAGAEVVNSFASPAAAAYDLSVWPLPEFAIDATTWPLALTAALRHHLQTEPDACVLEAYECGEWSGAENSNTPPPPLVQAASPAVDLVAACDDGLRRLLAEPDSADFFKPDPTVMVGAEDGVEQLDLGQIRARIAAGHYSSSVATTAAVNEVQRTMPPSEMLENLAVYRQGVHVLEKKPDCGKCRTCLEKPRFGGVNLMHSTMCLVRQQAEQSAFAGGTGGGGAQAAAIRNQLKAKRKLLDTQLDEKMAVWDEVLYQHHGGGGALGHEAIAADVRRVFRACRVNQKGNTKLLRVAARLEGLFFAHYYRFVACRDARYVPENRQALRLPEAMQQQQQNNNNHNHNNTDDMPVPPLVRQGFPSILQCVQAMTGSSTSTSSYSASCLQDFINLDERVKLVALGWLVDRALECVSPEVFTPLFESEAAKAASAKAAAAAAAAATGGDALAAAAPAHVGYTPLFSGLTRNYVRVWASPRMVRETGGLVLLEDLVTGQWSALHSVQQLDDFVASLDVRGRRECLLRRQLDAAHVEAIRQAMMQSTKELAGAVTGMRTGEQDLASAKRELDALPLDKARAVAALARAERQVQHDAAEAERKKTMDAARAKWKEAKNAEGKPYYYHADKRPPVWEKPKEVADGFAVQPLSLAEADLSKDELDLVQLERRVEQLSTTVELCESRLAFCRATLQRDRYVLLGDDGLAVKQPQSTPPLQQQRESPLKGQAELRLALVTDMMATEHFALGPGAVEFLGANADWAEEGRRSQWVQRARALASTTSSGSSSVVVVDQARELLVELFRVFVEAESLFAAKPLSQLGLALKQEEWRWTSAVRRASTVAELGLALAHLRRWVFPPSAPPASAASASAVASSTTAAPAGDGGFFPHDFGPLSAQQVKHAEWAAKLKRELLK